MRSRSHRSGRLRGRELDPGRSPGRGEDLRPCRWPSSEIRIAGREVGHARLGCPGMGLVRRVHPALLLGGAAVGFCGARPPHPLLWIAGTVLGLVFSVGWMVASIRRGQLSVDVIAVLALVGALLVERAVRRRDDHGDAVQRAAAGGAGGGPGAPGIEPAGRAGPADGPARHVEGGVVEVPVDDVVVGDRLLVGTGEVVPVDGRLLTPAVLDESALTGEPLPVERIAGDDVRSGVVNAGPPIDLLATTVAAASTYAGVVRLVEQAQASSAPFVRIADRFAILFVPLTLALAGVSWAVSGDPVRAVAVLVVATPCPLLLAAPIAIMSGLSRAAHLGVVIKGGGALERLAAGRVMLFDKTGTLTQGTPVLAEVVTAGGFHADELLRLAASLDQVSAHVLASAIVTAGTRRGLALDMPENVREVHGYGLEGTVGDPRVKLGKASWIVGDVGDSAALGTSGAAPGGSGRLSDGLRRDRRRARRRVPARRTRSGPTHREWSGRLRARRYRPRRAGHRRPRRHRRNGWPRCGGGHRVGRLRPGGQTRRHRAGVRARRNHHGRRRDQRRPRARRRGGRGGARRARDHSIVGGRRRRADRRPGRRARGRDPDCPAFERDCPESGSGRDGIVPGGHAVRGGRAATARGRCGGAGGRSMCWPSASRYWQSCPARCTPLR